MSCNTCHKRAEVRAELSGKFSSNINDLIKKIKESRRLNRDKDNKHGQKEV